MQHWNKPAIRFAEDILVLCNKVDPAMEEETKIEHVIGGMKKEYSFALYPPKTTDELLVVCKKMDYIEKKHRERVVKSRNLYSGPRNYRPQQQSRHVPPTATRNYQNTSKPQAPAPRYYQNKPLLQVSAPRRSYTSNPEPKPVYPRKTYNKSPDSNRNRTEDGRPICFKCNKPGHVARYCRVRFVRIVEEDPIVTQDKVEEEIRMDNGTEKSRPLLYADAFVEAEDGEYIIEENHKMFQTNRLRLARSLINVAHKETYIWITNPYPRPLKILKNKTLCFGSQPAEVNLMEESEQKEHEEPQFQINENLSYKEKEQLKQVLEKYADLFSSGLGRSNLTKHRIDTEGAKPIKHKPYRVSAKEREIIKDQIDEMLRDGIIRPSSSPWSFPVILVKKRDEDPYDEENEWDDDYERLFLNQIIDEKDDFIDNIKENLSGNKRSITQNFKEENGCLYKKNPNPEANFPFERIGIDFVGPMPTTKNRKKWIIVLTDYYTRYAETRAVSEATVKEVSKFLVEDIFLLHGASQYLISDRGSQFTSNLMKEVMKMCKIKHCFTTSYHPQTNGLTERLNRTLLNMLSMYVNTDQKNWDEILPFITHAYNTTIQETTGYSPFFLMYGREPTSLLDDSNISVDIDKDDYDEYIKHHLDKIDRARKLVINNTIKTQERKKKNYDKKHMERSYELGELVAVWTPIRKIGKCEKLLRKYFGPYRILKKMSSVNYLIEPKDNPGQDPLIVCAHREVTCSPAANGRAPPAGGGGHYVIDYKHKIIQHGSDSTSRNFRLLDSTPNEWPKWRKRFERYLVVSGMKKKEEADKIDLFMYLMGDRADDIFRTFKFEKEEEATKIDSVLKAFDSHFCVRKNIIYERAKFNSRIQEDREPVDEFITSLYKLADSCEFEGLHEQLIRDRIVVGVRDKALSERMQLDSELTLEKAVKMVRQQEAVRQQQVDLQRPSTNQKVNQVSAVEDSSNLDDDEGECRRRWTAEIQVNGKQVKFKLDSQADVTCVPLCLFKKIMGQQRLVESDINIRAAEFSELQTVGMFISTLRNGNYEIKEKIYVIRRLSEPLLSRRACELLNLARRIEVVATRINPIKEFPEVFEGLGQIGNPYEIKLKPGAKPYAVHTPRRVPIPLMEKLKTRLDIPGKELLDADALSRQPLLTTEGGEDERPTSAHINAVLSSITDKDEMLTKIFEAQQEDTTLKAVVNYLEQGWPDKKKMSQALLSYWHVKDELGVQNGLLMRSCRLVIPASMKLEILDKLHAGHFGITKTRLRARETVWWPGISEEIAETVRKCSVCIQEAVSKHEPLIPTNFPTRPWQKIGMDLFKFENKWYLVVIDYYSRFPEMVQLDRLTASVVVRSCKSIFARHGIPETVVSDNGTQFGAAREFANFARQYGFTHFTSSPRFPQSNGMAEAGVKIAKLILKKNQDPSLGLLEYRSTPLENGYSPAELLMGRKLRTTLPIAPENLNPKLVDSQTLKRKEGRRRKDMKDMRTWGIVKQKASTPRSYMVDTPVGTLRRNRFHLQKGVTVQYPADPSTPTFSGEELVENERTPVVDYPSNDSEDGQIRTRSGRIVKPVDRLHY
ncbi:hypothetical protein LAZ67_2003589 [Cordylochernes scorpioides]|uniref:RNA-directed DNA polymerase n=1 Tax=Cordylochernes scorpioides TaxID=51811 RepID=A0ABY6K5Y3_9ARAC|nr:hypothetical protein LAZ67_2003589 [Cordylochernes scorpioides]